MDLYKTKEFIDNFPNPDQFREKIQTLNLQLSPILDDFKKYYVFFNTNPEYPEYQQMFQNIKGNMTKLNSELFVLANNVQSNTEDINKKLFELDVLIKEEKRKNIELKRRLGIVEHKNNAASEMITDYTTIYDIDYLRNWGLFFCILIAGVAIKKTYTTQGI
jgi:hypothetical protein